MKIKIIILSIILWIPTFVGNSAFGEIISEKIYNKDRFIVAHHVFELTYGTEVRIVHDRDGLVLVLPVDVYITPQLAIDPLRCVQLDRIVGILQAYLHENIDDPHGIEITGHTDNIGYPADQEKLTYLYAKVIADYLVLHGITPAKITRLSGEGAKYPVVENENLLTRYLNRRVEIKILL
jgi:flagellar motor protein MotB